MLAFRIRQRFPCARITEAHPKALLVALGPDGPDFAERFGISTGWGNEHERDGAIARSWIRRAIGSRQCAISGPKPSDGGPGKKRERRRLRIRPQRGQSPCRLSALPGIGILRLGGHGQPGGGCRDNATSPERPKSGPSEIASSYSQGWLNADLGGRGNDRSIRSTACRCGSSRLSGCGKRGGAGRSRLACVRAGVSTKRGLWG